MVSNEDFSYYSMNLGQGNAKMGQSRTIGLLVNHGRIKGNLVKWKVVFGENPETEWEAVYLWQHVVHTKKVFMNTFFT